MLLSFVPARLCPAADKVVLSATQVGIRRDGGRPCTCSAGPMTRVSHAARGRTPYEVRPVITYVYAAHWQGHITSCHGPPARGCSRALQCSAVQCNAVGGLVIRWSVVAAVFPSCAQLPAAKSFSLRGTPVTMPVLPRLQVEGLRYARRCWLLPRGPDLTSTACWRRGRCQLRRHGRLVGSHHLSCRASQISKPV